MLPKKNRTNKKEVEKIFKYGRSVNSSFFTFRFKLNSDSTTPQISFIAPKSVARLAVKRNLLRRRGYSVLEKHLFKFPPGFMGVFIFKKYQDDILIIENEIKNILIKIN
ncbi:hypothetical protein A3C60_00755 [Candidatus Nomurabacteria bacterium RIFCSPHIGHO2_02_FULL_37_45]|uniref:Uncharacterized protein n=2 Tax=Candidatus Nomuraibacteriota TaxID=1752729 RepID=A0A1F6Y5W5_9BACT|nr:MAG: hypothetical protein A2727_02655 [Candidatus Nomurabacteria bacterium RIFCSPHIGHO2_01_FULL_37_110]OGI72271.1 MAG: hypothetical protein A3C60_00755 [Candidatus Nomurabacteria bacterium RIFCSPHIGHO2_02_FULL_37_45]OGI78892.1 MAG: hypothetical protein A3F19_03200 [Candidatus Nomurabacteria bacterium RIFCSPHIGHO2_12_FULL_37_29]OGJ01748.1 MAG: hypothetical protein A3G98_00020 [Candidatus Nomurabacteria bacterium RIFCSPLOWO2_12_FULL_37_8]